MTEEMSFQVLLENCQGLSITDTDRQFIPPARNGEWKRSGKWFCASLWWHHEASLTRRSQTSGRDVDCRQWVEVGGCWACSIELDASCNREPVQVNTERCDMSPFGFIEDQSCCCILNHLCWQMCFIHSFLTTRTPPTRLTQLCLGPSEV